MRIPWKRVAVITAVAVPVAAVVGVLSRFAVSRYMASRFYDPDGGSGGGDPPAPETA